MRAMMVLVIGLAIVVGCKKKADDAAGAPAAPRRQADASLAKMLPEFVNNMPLADEKWIGRVMVVEIPSATLVNDATEKPALFVGKQDASPEAIIRLADTGGLKMGETTGPILVEMRVIGFRKIADFAWAQPWHNKPTPASGKAGWLFVGIDGKVLP